MELEVSSFCAIYFSYKKLKEKSVNVLADLCIIKKPLVCEARTLALCGDHSNYTFEQAGYNTAGRAVKKPTDHDPQMIKHSKTV
jgi:hypothetical protein